MKGKHLQVGQYVIVSHAPKQKGPSVMILKVLAVEYPYALFGYEASHPVLAMPGLAVEQKTHKEVAVVHVAGHRFHLLSESFVAQALKSDIYDETPSWMSEKP